MSEYMTWIWLAFFVLLLIAEALTVQLTTIWFAGGALVAMTLSLFGVKNIAVQTGVFLAVSLILLIATRPLVKKHLNSKTQPTNADRNIGKEAIVTSEINNLLSVGTVKVSGTEWSARSESGKIIPEGTVVTVKNIDGVKLIVE